MKQTLSQSALTVIKAYKSLQFGDNQVCTPYFNNKRQKVRGALRVLVGKGTPEEIVEEAKLMAVRAHVDLDMLNAVELNTFLIDHYLGVDCSGFVYHVLNAEVHARTGKKLKSFLKFPNRSIIRKLLAILRTVENTNVKILAHDKNSSNVKLVDVKPGDIITMIGSKKVGNPDHVLLIESAIENKITYVHSYKFSTDGKYSHGIKHGSITLTDDSKKIEEQSWDETEMLQALKEANDVHIKRLYGCA
jgi:hypothetical protein